MKIYRTSGENGYEFVQVKEPGRELIFMELTGKKLLPGWVPPRVRVVSFDEGKSRARADLLWIGAFSIAMRDSAVKKLHSVLDGQCEILPTAPETDGVFVLNVPVIEAALDEDRSQVTRFENGKIFQIKSHAFNYEKLAGLNLFRIKQSPQLFVSDEFVRRVNTEGFRGITFPLVEVPN